MRRITKMMKRTKYRSKGGTVRRMGGGMAKKNTKYKSKGGAVRRKRGGRAK